MAKKGKMKISKIKRNNQTTNKMKKQGKLRLQRHRQKVHTQKQSVAAQPEFSSDNESASGEEWADMLDEEEQSYIMNRLVKQPRLLSDIPEEQKQKKKLKRKRKDKSKTTESDSGAHTDDSDSDVEEKYEKELSERPKKKFRPLLPIKTKDGLLERVEEIDDVSDLEDVENKMHVDDDENDSGVEGTLNDSENVKVVTTIELMATRRDKLNHDKLRIGALCSSLLEEPEKKLKNLYPVLYFMEEYLKDGTLNLHSIRKLATLSAFEVFKDILPDYHIRHQDYSNIKLKKETLALYKYEKELLEFYKRYLQRLEKQAAFLRRKKGDNRTIDEATRSLALISLKCMCGMLVARPNFNYSTNIAQSVIPFLSSKDSKARELISESCSTIFKEDVKGDITLTIVRLINQLVKRRGDKLQPSALDCLLDLKIKDIDLDAEADLKHKKKKEEKHKKRIVNLSKKEKKRAKKLKEVEKELLETEAKENEMAVKKQMTEVTKTVFHIYFKLLKSAPRSKLLAAALNGLAKFTHVINLEFYSDLLSILARLLTDDQIKDYEKLLCVRTVLAILSGSGDVLNVDPARFHLYLYSTTLSVHAGASHEDAKIILESIAQVCARARRVSPAVLQAFAKRLLTLSLQLHHNGALACLALLYQMTQNSKAVATLMEGDSESAGSGRFDPYLESPEHCNAASASPHELRVLRYHYHPSIREAAQHLMKDAGKVATSPIGQILKLSSVQIFEEYDGTQMGFKPAIPPPTNKTGKSKVTSEHKWAQPSFKDLCETTENNVSMNFPNANLRLV